MNTHLDETMFLCERVMAEICSEFEDDFGGEWSYDVDRNEHAFILRHNDVKVGATLFATSIRELTDMGVNEVQLFKMFYSAWGKLLPESYPDLKEALHG